ncbi:hypothetical protein L6259_03700 [Candidatus Parcubacteria bacterium]|nr:hypothetical protein [Patescibacteria group bacterium]MCG2694340.1 hypothetical protein [Candidatus Parcubacteria bacterium]
MAFNPNQESVGPPEAQSQSSTKKPADKEGELKASFKFSFWFFRNKPFLKKVFMGLVIVVVAAPWTYTLIWLLDWAVITGPKERANLNTILDIKVSQEALANIAATPLYFSEAEIFAGGIGQYDIFSQVKNQNAKWWMEFQYRFVGEGLEGDWRNGFVLPDETKYITNLGVERAFRPRNIRLETRDIKYHRINNHLIPDYAEFKKERMDIVVSDTDFDPRAIQNKKNIALLSFMAKNNTAYDYWLIGFYTYLYRGDQLVALNYIGATEFLSGESRDLEIYFYEGLPAVSRYEIVPELNIFDEDGYIR